MHCPPVSHSPVPQAATQLAPPTAINGLIPPLQEVHTLAEVQVAHSSITSEHEMQTPWLSNSPILHSGIQELRLTETNYPPVQAVHVVPLVQEEQFTITEEHVEQTSPLAKLPSPQLSNATQEALPSATYLLTLHYVHKFPAVHF